MQNHSKLRARQELDALHNNIDAKPTTCLARPAELIWPELLKAFEVNRRERDRIASRM